MNVPFLDLQRVHEPLANEFVDSFRSILQRSAFSSGKEIQEFEAAFAEFVGTKYCLGTCSGLSALMIGLRTAGVKPGDKIIAPTLTFVATLEAIRYISATPVLVDVDSHGSLDLKTTEEYLKQGVKFILPVHLYGMLADPIKLVNLAKKYNAVVIEDACQAHGAKNENIAAGTIGKVSAFSFYPGKNLGALGDAGALCTDDENVFKMAKALREHGQLEKYHHTYEGYTARLDNIQAAFLLKKLPHLKKWTEERISAAKTYYELLQDADIAFQSNDFSGSHVFHLFVVVTKQREKLISAFKSANIGFGLHYPQPMHKLECYQNQDWVKGEYPNAERFSKEAISLPIFPGITRTEIVYVCDVIKKTL